jgi:hypothetical protein
MSQENLERVREQYARYNAGERAPGRWFWHEDAEYHTAREDPDHAVHRGIDAIGKLFAKLGSRPTPTSGSTSSRPKHAATRSSYGFASPDRERRAESPSRWSWLTS